jgi:hypothetical protein
MIMNLNLMIIKNMQIYLIIYFVVGILNQQKRMKDVSKIELYELIKNKMTESDFNVYQIVMERF